MKRNIFPLLLFLLSLMINSCKSSDDPFVDDSFVDDPLIIVNDTDMILSNEGGRHSITFESNMSWTAESSENWCTVYPAHGDSSTTSLTIILTTNENYDARHCSILFKAGSLTKNITVNQSPQLGLLVTQDKYDLSNVATTIEVEVKANVEFDVEIAENWITTASTRGLTTTKINFDIAKNDTYVYRYGTINIKERNGTLSSVVKVSQTPRKVAFLTNPYLQNVKTTGITIMWESEYETAGKVYYGTANNYKNEVSASVVMTNANTYINKTEIKGLLPNTKYSYFVDQSGEESEKYTFATAPDSGESSFKATIWADSHNSLPWSRMVNYMMTEIQPNLAFNAGDISNFGDKRYDLAEVFLPYVCEKIGSYVPFYSALGNHDVNSHWGGGELVRQFHDQPKEVNSDLKGFSGSYLMMYSNVAFIFIDWNRMETDLLPDGWLEQTLQSESVQGARFRFIFIHAAPYYERGQNMELSKVKLNLPRISETYKVDAVFSGHVHSYERGIKGGVQYFTIGGGSYLSTSSQVGPVIYDHIIRGTNKLGNPSGFNNGLRNHFAELIIEKSKAEIKIHYFDSQGKHLGVIESVFLNGNPTD